MIQSKTFFILALFLSFSGCLKDNETDSVNRSLTIFMVNDVHGQIDNFSKVKYIIDTERLENDVIVVSSGDLFSGNPVVDNYPEKGYPMIDLMNQVGFDMAVLGNHEFDYGEAALKSRMEQSNFEWVCANVDMNNSIIPEPSEFKTIQTENFKITFLGLVETDGKDNGTIPSTHPYKVENLIFERPESVVARYADVKERENANLYIALSHLGFNGYNGHLGDIQLASQFPYFDLIIGGHSHQLIDTVINNIPIFQSGSYLNYLGKINLSVKDDKIESSSFDLIDLNRFSDYDHALQKSIDAFNDLPLLDEVVGYSESFLNYANVGCFYVDALKGAMNVDVSFQNTGGIRSALNEGDITKRELFEISPFNNGTVIYTMSVSDIKKFLRESGSGFYYAGIQIVQFNREIDIMDLHGVVLSDNILLTIGMNDYIPAVYDYLFPANGDRQIMTDAETLIFYLENMNGRINYAGCDQYFRFR